MRSGWKRAAHLLAYYGFLRYLPRSYAPGGTAWKYLRFLACRRLFKSCGTNVNVERGAYFGTGEHLEIGDNSGLGVDCWIERGVSIGANVMMGPEVIIFTRNHRTARTDVPIREQGYEPQQPVLIGDDVWIGARAIILPGVHVGTGAVVGAGAVVSHAVPEYAVVAGNPAREVRRRSNRTTNNS
jgi:maltose O-acetyltransferase